jgi:Helix-turn-helix domain
VRLLGFAGKDARCYPSLERLGKGLGVSDRQARDYVKELERVGLIAVEQRGLRKTNVYLFLWTAELQRLCNSVPDSPDGPDEGSEDPSDPPPTPNPTSGLDRNSCSAPDRNCSSALDRNSCSGQERNYPSGPIGINSEGISSLESSSSLEVLGSPPEAARRRTIPSPQELAAEEPVHRSQTTNRTAAMIVDWANKRNLQRLRSDRQIGLPEKDRLTEWAAILEARGIADEDQVCSVLDAARAGADRCGEWRNWGFLTLQIQLSAERLNGRTPSGVDAPMCPALPTEDPESIWAKAKTRIRSQIPETAFLNWFSCTLQIMTCDSEIEVAVPDEVTGAYLRNEYRDTTGSA